MQYRRPKRSGSVVGGNNQYKRGETECHRLDGEVESSAFGYSEKRETRPKMWMFENGERRRGLSPIYGALFVESEIRK
jgi:hypothetical protein